MTIINQCINDQRNVPQICYADLLHPLGIRNKSILETWRNSCKNSLEKVLEVPTLAAHHFSTTSFELSRRFFTDESLRCAKLPFHVPCLGFSFGFLQNVQLLKGKHFGFSISEARAFLLLVPFNLAVLEKNTRV